MKAGSLLYARAHGALILTAALIMLSLLELGRGKLKIGPHQTYVVPLAICLPMAAGAATATFLQSPMSNWEQGALRPMSLVRTCHGVAILAVGSGLTWAATTHLHGTFTSYDAIRNYGGCAGLGMLAASFAPPLYAWIAPTGYAFAALTTGITDEDKPGRWAWALYNDQHPWTFGVSALFAAVGTACFAVGNCPLASQMSASAE